MPKVFDSSSSAVGAVQSAMITEAQFQAQFGTGWVLADGRSVAGSKYASITGSANIPDLRGVVLRGKNNSRSDGNQNPGGERALGFYESDQMQGHFHSAPTTNGVGGQYEVSGGGTGYDYGAQSAPTTGPISDNVNGTPRTGLETRPKNVTVNYFIRIN